MAKISLAGFKDPVRRPRYIIWTGVVLMMLVAVMIVALGVTSTRWFCSEACHKVQDDTIVAYQRSSHSNISCMACHMPVNANPVIFILHKAEALGELYLTVRDDFELPLNGESEVSLTMTTDKCTQCHNLETRVITPSKGIKIDHKKHTDVNVECTICHNRIAHKEDFDLVLKDPKTGEPNRKHQDFMSMTSCFRCHSLEDGAAAPGTCSACHSPTFELKPPSHREAGFYPKGHAELAKEMKAESAKAKAEHEKALAEKGEKPEEVAEVIEEQKKAGEGAGNSHKSSGIGEKLPTVESVFYCGTCHKDKFCTDCHGMEMPHPAEFKEPKDVKDATGHPAVSKVKPAKCVQCHGKNEKTHFCDECHHGTKLKYEFNKSKPWINQHPEAVAKSGIKACTSCHAVKFCVDCHTGRKVFPASHREARWLRPKSRTVTQFGSKPAEPTAKHATAALTSIESCEVCHGSGGANAKFCKSCHKYEMPHPAEFKKFHAKSKSSAAKCAKCHSWREVCSNCHHAGSSYSRPWTAVHGSSVNKNGPAGCIEKCHKKNDCVKCHQKRNVKPASHNKAKFVRDRSSAKANHTKLYAKDGEICTYCHKGAASELPGSKFCNGCHKLEMPHQLDSGNNQKFVHKDGFKSKKLKKSTCANCHGPSFCNSCHHKESVASKPWIRYHPKIVKKSGATACFECHKETYCSNCHVNLAKRGLLN